jgi:hypothetical protein
MLSKMTMLLGAVAPAVWAVWQLRQRAAGLTVSLPASAAAPSYWRTAVAIPAPGSTRALACGVPGWRMGDPTPGTIRTNDGCTLVRRTHNRRFEIATDQGVLSRVDPRLRKALGAKSGRSLLRSKGAAQWPRMHLPQHQGRGSRKR